MNKNEKYTRINKYNDIKAILAATTVTGYDISALTQFCDEQVASLEKKAIKAKETAAAKKAEKDELCELVMATLSDVPQTREEITDQIALDDVTPSKVGARLTKLFNAGEIQKDTIKVEGSTGKKHNRMVYFIG